MTAVFQVEVELTAATLAREILKVYKMYPLPDVYSFKSPNALLISAGLFQPIAMNIPTRASTRGFLSLLFNSGD